jgi:peptidoglycan DL-endopeptidase CwlO
MKLLHSLLCSSVISSLLLTTAHAESIDELNNSLNNINKQVTDAKSQKDELNAETVKLEKALQSINQQIKTNKLSIETIQKEILQLNGKIDKNQKELDQAEHEFGQQAKVVYEEGDVTFLSVLLEAKSFEDFLTRLDAFRMIAKSDANQIANINTLQQTIIKEKEDNQQKLKSVVQKQQDLNTLKETKNVIQQQKEDQIEQLDKLIHSKKEDADRIQAKIDFEKKEAMLAKQHPILDDSENLSFGSGGTYQGSAGEIISFASRFKGVPYAWGGTSPAGFDCSGFTQYVFGQAGIRFSRTAAAQFHQGTPVSGSDLKPGDLVFFSTYGPGPTHVGIYIGYDMMIDAEDSGVSVSNIRNSYWGPRYIGARRVLS